MVTETQTLVYGGIDTHADTHHVAVIDHLGTPLGDLQVPATCAGYRAALGFLNGWPQLGAVGIESINGLIELARRIARGFRNRDNYRLRMLLIGGGLDGHLPT